MGDQNNHDRSNCDQCLRDDLETANERIAELERENEAIQSMYDAQCGKTDELIAELAAEREVKGDARIAELELALATVNGRLAAAQATIQRMREVVERVVSLKLGPHGYCSSPLLKLRISAISARALPNDRTALDAMLAEARKEGMLRAERICRNRAEDRFNEYGTREWDTNACYYTGDQAEFLEAADEESEACADAIRQAAERSGE